MNGTDRSHAIFEEEKSLAAIREADRILDVLERLLRQFGAQHVLITGLPMPRRPVNKLILRISWPDRRNDGYLLGADSHDPLLIAALTIRHPFRIAGGALVADTCPDITGRMGSSELVEAAGADATVRVIPVHDLPPFQGAVIFAAPELSCTMSEAMALEYFCQAVFRRLREVGRIDGGRPGDLSERERRVLELTAIGKTANEIAELLEISQRTVHAHLQNASEKLNASNKTHTVVEALRYGQIAL